MRFNCLCFSMRLIHKICDFRILVAECYYKLMILIILFAYLYVHMCNVHLYKWKVVIWIPTLGEHWRLRWKDRKTWISVTVSHISRYLRWFMILSYCHQKPSWACELPWSFSERPTWNGRKFAIPLEPEGFRFELKLCYWTVRDLEQPV